MRLGRAVAATGAVAAGGGAVVVGAAELDNPNTEVVWDARYQLQGDPLAHAINEPCHHPAGFKHDDACRQMDGSVVYCRCVPLGATGKGRRVLDELHVTGVPGSDELWCGPVPLNDPDLPYPQPVN